LGSQRHRFVGNLAGGLVCLSARQTFRLACAAQVLAPGYNSSTAPKQSANPIA
jgi:hypothetical protein